MSIQSVVADVSGAALEPVNLDWSFGHVEVVYRPDGVERFLPVELLRHVSEEGFRIVYGLIVHCFVFVQGFDVRVRGEVGGRRVEVLLASLGDVRGRLGGDVVKVHSLRSRSGCVRCVSWGQGRSAGAGVPRGDR